MNQREKILRDSGPSVRKNTVISLVLSGVRYLYPVVVFVYAARILHPEGPGQTSYASSLAAFFALFTGLGMSIYGLRSTAVRRSSPQELSRQTAELIILRVLAGIFAWIVYFAVLLLFGKSDDRVLLIIYGFSILAAIPECSWFYRGMEDYSSMAWITARTYCGSLLALFLLVRDASDLFTYAWISVLVPFVISMAELLFAEWKWHLRILPVCREMIVSGNWLQAVRKHLRPLLLFFLMSCAVTIYSHTDTVMLRWMQDERTVGLYACAARLKSMLPVLTGVLWAAALPKSTELWNSKRKDAFRELAGKSFHVVHSVMLPLVVYFGLFAEPWIILIGGADYLDAALTMRILLLAVVPIGFSNIIGGQMLIPMGLEKKLFFAEVFGAVSNIILNLALIPFLSAPGAAIATVVSETLVTVLAAWFVLKQVRMRILQPKNLLLSIVGCILAGLASFGVASLVSWPVLLKCLLSAAVFGLLFCLVMLVCRDSLYREMFSFGFGIVRKILPGVIRKPLGKIYRGCKRGLYRLEAALFPRKAVFFCPCCGTRLRAFIAGHYMEHPERFNPARYEPIPQEVLCPACGSMPRHRILVSWFKAHLSLLSSSDILYFAPEVCTMQWMKKHRVSCTTADLYQKADLQLDIQKTGLPDASWDLIVCNHVLEHVADFRAALKELHRILRPGGHLICSFPMDPGTEIVEEASGELSEEERIRRFGQNDHLRVFGMYPDVLLQEAGFTVERICGEDYPAEILPVVGPADYDMNCLFDCRK